MLSLNNVSKTFEGCTEPVLKNINLNLNPGELCMVVGANGAGKSTLMQVIAEEYIHHKIAFVVQDVNKGTIPEMTLFENMVLSRARTQKSVWKFYNRFFYKKQILNKLTELKAMSINIKNINKNINNINKNIINTDFSQYLHKPLSVLSGGQRQMIATLMALYSEPAILLLDEPMSALDIHKQHVWIEYVTNCIRHYNITSVMITHNLQEAITMGDRLVVLHKGEIVLNITGEQKNNLQSSDVLSLMMGN